MTQTVGATPQQTQMQRLQAQRRRSDQESQVARQDVIQPQAQQAIQQVMPTQSPQPRPQPTPAIPVATPQQPQTHPTTLQAPQPSLQDTALKNLIYGGASALKSDTSEEESIRLAEIDRQAELSRKQLARQFALTPGGTQGGASQRQFENFEGSLIGTKAQMQADLRQRSAEEARANLASQAGILQQFTSADLAQQQQNLQREIQYAQATGNLNGARTLAAQAQDVDTEIRRRQQDVSESAVTGQFKGQQTMDARKMNQEQSQFLTQQTGKIGGGNVSAQTLGLDVTQAFNADGTPNLDNWFQLADSVTAALQGAGIEPTADQIAQVLSGGSISSGVETIAGREMSLREESQNLTRQIAEAEATGRWGDVETLAAKKQNLDEKIAAAAATGEWENKATLESQAQDLQARIAEAQATGKWGEVATLAQQAQNVQNRLATLQETETRAAQTGLYQENATLDSLGLAPSASADQIKAAFKAKTGRDITGAELVKLSTGGSVAFDRQTLASQAQGLTARMEEGKLALQQGNFELAKQIESNRRSEAVAVMTGKIDTEMSANDLGLNTEAIWDANGNVKPGQMDAAMDALSTVNDAAVRAIGRGLTQAEVNALKRGQPIKLGQTKTLAAQAQETQKAIDEAQLTGKYADLPTLNAKKLEFDQALAKQQQDWTQQMDLASQTGYVAIGQSGKMGASEFGIDTTYTKGMDATAILASDEAARLKDTYQTLTGQQLSDVQVVDMLRGNQINAPAGGIRVETTSARAQREQTSMAWSQLSGTIGAQKTEAARQFDAQLAQQSGMNAAQIAQINAGIQQADRKLENDMAQFAATTSLNLMELTGGGNGSITAETLGVDLKGASSQEQKSAALKAGFKNMAGRDPSPVELQQMLQGKTVEVKGSQTLAARELATKASAAALQHETDMMKISQDYGIEKDKLDQYVKESDRNYALTAQESAQKYGLDQQKFAMAKMELDAQLFGSVDGKQTLSREQWAQQVADTARMFGLEESKFKEAVAEFDANFDLQDRNTWAQLTGQAIGVTGGVSAGQTAQSMEGQQNDMARQALRESDARTDLIWTQALTRGGGSAKRSLGAGSVTIPPGANDAQKAAAMRQYFANSPDSAVVGTMSDADLVAYANQYQASNITPADYSALPSARQDQIARDEFIRAEQEKAAGATQTTKKEQRQVLERDPETGGQILVTREIDVPVSTYTPKDPTPADIAAQRTTLARNGLARPVELSLPTGGGMQNFNWSELMSLSGIVTGNASAVGASIRPSAMSQIGGVVGQMAGIGGQVAAAYVGRS